MIRFFLGNSIIALFFLPLIILVFQILNNQFPYHEIEKEINYGFWNGLFNLPIIASQVIASLLILVNSIVLNFTYNNYNFQDKNSYIVSLIYVVLMSFYYSFYRFDGILMSHTFLILCLAQFYQLNQNKDGKQAVFNGAFLLGCAATFHPPLLVFFPVYIIMYLLLRPFILRELFIFTTGFISPLLFGITYLKWVGKELTSKLILDKVGIELHKDFIIILVFILILLVLSAIGIRNRIIQSTNRLKKQIQMLWLLVLVAIIIGSIDLYYYQQIERFSLLLVSMPIILSFSFLNKRYGVLATVLFYLTIAYAVIKFFLEQTLA
jgi:hypothetical protein